MNGENKCVIITGASSGIGAVTAEKLARSGYDLALFDITSVDKIEEVSERCKKINPSIKTLCLSVNVAVSEECANAVTKTAETFGGIYGLVNNAGITRDALLMRMTEDQFDSVINVNLKSMFNMTKPVITYMTKARTGRIVNISSVVGVYGNAGQTNYSAAKAGVIGFSKSLAKEIGSRGITVNAVAPGYIRTPMTDDLPENAKTELSSRISLKRLGESADVANLVSFLLSDDASYITAQVIGVDGGF